MDTLQPGEGADAGDQAEQVDEQHHEHDDNHVLVRSRNNWGSITLCDGRILQHNEGPGGRLFCVTVEYCSTMGEQ